MPPTKQAIGNANFGNFDGVVLYMQFQVIMISKLDSNLQNNSNKIRSMSHSKLQVDISHFASKRFQTDARSMKWPGERQPIRDKFEASN